MRRFVVIVFIMLTCVFFALWSPWLYWKFDIATLFGIKKPEVISGLQVFSLNGEMEVFLDNKSFGKVNLENSPLILDKVVIGEHLITLKKISLTPNAYIDFIKLVTFSEGTNVVLSYNLGPLPEFSEGQIIYTSRKADIKKDNQININVNTAESFIQIDGGSSQQVNGNLYSKSISLDTQHKIKISKKGFEPLEFTVLPESKEDRNKLKNFDINIEIQLMFQPIEIN